MNKKDILLVGIIFLAMFTIFTIENERPELGCKKRVTVKSMERPYLYESYE
jgi:hypothetical protein